MHPLIARLYAHVHPLFWPFLWLQLRRVCRRFANDPRTILIATTWWGRITLVAVGDAPADPRAWAPRQRFRNWSDLRLATALPLGLAEDRRPFAARCAPRAHGLRAHAPAPDPG